MCACPRVARPTACPLRWSCSRSMPAWPTAPSCAISSPAAPSACARSSARPLPVLPTCAAVPVGRHDRPAAQGGDKPDRGDPPRYRDPRNVMDQTYDMRMPPFMRHSMGVPLSITRRHYDLLMAWLDKLETDPDWRADALRPDPE